MHHVAQWGSRTDTLHSGAVAQTKVRQSQTSLHACIVRETSTIDARESYLTIKMHAHTCLGQAVHMTRLLYSFSWRTSHRKNKQALEKLADTQKVGNKCALTDTLEKSNTHTRAARPNKIEHARTYCLC